jgi:hypothetical protein
LGEWLRIEDRLERLGKILEARFSKSGDGIAKGFVTASLIFCVGAMAIVGALESGLAGNHQTLFAKSTIDGITSIVFCLHHGIGRHFLRRVGVHLPGHHYPVGSLRKAVSGARGGGPDVCCGRNAHRGHRHQYTGDQTIEVGQHAARYFRSVDYAVVNQLFAG